MNLSYQIKSSWMIKNGLFFAILSLIIPITAYTQKLPDVQKDNLRAPANLKIDGNAKELGDTFQAYNNATGIFYTICNDDQNLYLFIKSADPDVLTKITNRGIVFSINAADIKKDEKSASVSFPVFELQYGNKPNITFTNAAMLHAQRVALEQNADSVSRVANKRLRNCEKYIRTSGLRGVDTLISIYNRDGINAAESFDSKMAYTYELAVPLKYFGINKVSKFAYHIVLPGINIDKDYGLQITKTSDGKTLLSTAPGTIPVKGSHLPAVTSTTDFWGEYILAK